MRHAVTILKWEIQKILSSWQKTLAVFLIPAAVMVFAINLFPKLLNYLSTGTMGSQKIIVINAPDSFMEFPGKKDDLYSYSYMTMEESDPYFETEEGVFSLVKNGTIVVGFATDSGRSFDESVAKEYYDFYVNDTEGGPDAQIIILYNEEQMIAEAKADQFTEDIIDTYVGYLDSEFGSPYVDEVATFSTDSFNPITFILDNRSVANTQAARVIPGIMVILIYYCVYSLTCDMIAMEKNRGFLSKLIMTPVSAKTILWGKALAINILVTGSSLVTFLFLFLSSWINRSNDAGSLLPFGLMLMPDQLIYMVLSIPATVLVMTAFCFLVALELEKFEDTVANLQLVLLLLLIGFFIQMFLVWDPIVLEYIIPGHNLIVLLKEIILSEVNIAQFLAVLIVNLGLGLFLMKRCAKNLTEGVRHDRSKRRKKKIFF